MKLRQDGPPATFSSKLRRLTLLGARTRLRNFRKKRAADVFGELHEI